MTGSELAKLLEPAIERLGYELSDLEVKLAVGLIDRINMADLRARLGNQRERLCV